MFNMNQPWHLRMPRRLRFIDAGADAGGADGENGRKDHPGKMIEYKPMQRR